jgi:MFS family permease
VGLVAALAYAIENAHQSWGAVMLADVLSASPQLAAAAPATFAATAALARLGLAPLSRSHPTAVLLGGGTLATAGSAVLATAPSVAVALAGLVLAALGTATLFPTLLSRSLRGTDPAQHGRATSTVATTAYVGFLLGPAYVGLLTASSDLRGALVGVAALALIFTLAAAPISAWAARGAQTRSM